MQTWVLYIFSFITYYVHKYYKLSIKVTAKYSSIHWVRLTSSICSKWWFSLLIRKYVFQFSTEEILFFYLQVKGHWQSCLQVIVLTNLMCAVWCLFFSNFCCKSQNREERRRVLLSSPGFCSQPRTRRVFPSLDEKCILGKQVRIY